MARNVVQFQKGSQRACVRTASTARRSNAGQSSLRHAGRVALNARHAVARSTAQVKTRDLFQCTMCRRQTSPIAGTIFASTHLPLRLWFRAMYHLTQTKQGISSIELGRRLGVTQTTAWKIKHKLKQVMLERDATKRLTGRVEIDDAYLGGERSGGKRGRGAPGKTPFVAAVETTPDGKPVRLKLRRVTSFCATSISGFAKRSLDPDCSVVSDGLQCFASVATPDARTRSSRQGQDQGGSDACLQMGQHRAGQHQGRHHRNLPRHQQQACPALSRRIRIPLQQAIRSGRHDPAPHMGRRPNHTHALSAPEIG